MPLPKWQIKELAFLLKTRRHVVKRKSSYQRNRDLREVDRRINRLIKGE
jgi:hypothetical protein